ncbi:Flp family type IVb pilin [Phycicoccus sp. MAQZ13P-2]|uniref:Flp family type IVb pilin n=1 Tax=Phycicoccus mangrovi TaxID=2840470 RepID=UPI001C00670A|nr:Flp family type IVb pilin [Phycicoccus mangrovi]MBT9255907.1 Flp family type IVb pilin [Phycicoccus mangrovi]MBT9274501.1 Flp family type IVb pilin [Phycicoccus mangrovi]
MTQHVIRRTAAARSRLAPLLATRRERGATAVEYALMIGLVAIVIIASVTILGRNLTTFFQNAAASI